MLDLLPSTWPTASLRGSLRQECSWSEHQVAQWPTYPWTVRTQPRLLITWAGDDLEALLGALGLDLQDGAIELASARLEVDRSEPVAGRPRLRVEELPAGSGPGAVATEPLDLAAVGWATVELERAARDVGGTWEPAAHDRLLGATAWRSPQDHPATLLLEPNTEGRLAGALARHGEGPIALYLRARDPGRVGAVLRARPGSGPFGEEWLIPGLNPAGPYLILVAEQPAPEDPDRVPSQP
jgi:hypothetical protein